MGDYEYIKKLCQEKSFVESHKDLLSDRHYKVLLLRYGHIDGVNHTFKSIGLQIPNGWSQKKYNSFISHERARQMHFKCLKLIDRKIKKMIKTYTKYGVDNE